jgi:hypothetical protein
VSWVRRGTHRSVGQLNADIRASIENRDFVSPNIEESVPPIAASESQPMRLDLAIMLSAFVLASALAGALGAINLGTALAFGQIAFALAAVMVIVRRP